MGRGAGEFAASAARLYRVRQRNMDTDVRRTIEQRDRLQSSFHSMTDQPLVERDVLVIGGGQTCGEVYALAAGNRVTAIDLDVVAQGWRPGPYVELLRENGSARAAKTIGRKVLGIDRRFRDELCRQLGVGHPPTAEYRRMDAAAMSFQADAFDLVTSFSVFEHLVDPKAALAHAIRVLRPGGVLSISLHLYSAEGGCHDLRIFAGDRASIPLWAHLRPRHKHTVIESCYMNEWRLDAWRRLFLNACPGAAVVTDRHHRAFDEELVEALAHIRAGAELEEYTDEELLAVNVRMTWRKPTASCVPEPPVG